MESSPLFARTVESIIIDLNVRDAENELIPPPQKNTLDRAILHGGSRGEQLPHCPPCDLTRFFVVPFLVAPNLHDELCNGGTPSLVECRTYRGRGRRGLEADKQTGVSHAIVDIECDLTEYMAGRMPRETVEESLKDPM